MQFPSACVHYLDMSHLACDASELAVVQPVYPDESLRDILVSVANRCGDDFARRRILEALPLMDGATGKNADSTT